MAFATNHEYLLPSKPQPAFWSRDSDGFHDHRTTPELPQRADVLIIGGGYSGAATAWHLVKDRAPGGEKQSIVLLEARGVCSGATGRNGGHLRPDLYGHIPTFVKRSGLVAAIEVAEFEIAHVAAIKKLVEAENIDCDFVLTRSIDVWANQDAADAARSVYAEFSGHSLAYMDDVFFKYGPDAEKFSGVKGAKAAASYTAGTIWPYKLFAHLLKSLVDTGDPNLQTNTPVTEVSSHPTGGFEVRTPRGTIHAKNVVHANNAYAAKFLPEYTHSIVPCKGICCRITVPEGKTAPLLSNSYIERNSNDTLSYLIPRLDGSIVVGGASSLFKPHVEQWYNNVDDTSLIESAKDYYDGYMQRTFLGWEDSGAAVDQIWTGVMGYTYDTHPSIGSVPGRPGQFIIAGFNGHGMPVIFLSAKGLAKMINEGSSFEDAKIPRLFKTTADRIRRAQHGNEDFGDIIGDGSLVEPHSNTSKSV